MQGVGIDILEIDRIAPLISREAFLKRVYTQGEREYLKSCGKQAAQSAAGMFCAKEAVAKALGTGFSRGLAFRDIEISHTAKGMPQAVVAGHEQLSLSLSISHCRTHATAMVVLWKEQK